MSNNFFFSENRAIYDIILKKTGTATDDNITRRMRFACRLNKVGNPHLEYVIFIAFPRQK